MGVCVCARMFVCMYVNMHKYNYILDNSSIRHVISVCSNKVKICMAFLCKTSVCVFAYVLCVYSTVYP